MGFFTCNSCGECLKKNAVQKHSFRCRTSQGISCMDCHKVFGEDFVNHLSCVTEQEKYGGLGFVAKETKNKKKQEQWVEKVVEAWKNDVLTKSHFNRYFQDSNKWQNIPRNITKLKNYLTNSLKMRADLAEKFSKIATRVLESINQERNQQTNPNESKRKADDDGECGLPTKKPHLEEIKGTLTVVNKEETTNDVVNLEKATKKHKKKVVENGSTHDGVEDFKVNTNKENNSIDNNGTGENTDSSKFKWKSCIKNTLRAHNSKMKLKKLQKIIVNQYLSYIGDEDCAQEAKELFQKKINNNNKFIILKDKYIQLNK